MDQYREQFILPDSVDNLPAFAKHVTGRIREHITSHVAHASMLLRAKWVIMELQTNRVKHAQAHKAWLDVYFDGNDLHITKTDDGSPLALKGCRNGRDYHWPLAAEQYPAAIEVYGDDIYVLRAKIDAEGTAHFFAEEKSGVLNKELLNEHFGLLIVARSSDAFSYRYDNKSKTNIFTCIISERHYFA